MNHSPSQAEREATSDTSVLEEAVAHHRRLSDKILLAFHHACDEHDLAVATSLLLALELLISRPSTNARTSRRRSIESLVGAHCRLWDLKQQPRPGTALSADDMFAGVDSAATLLS